MATTKQKTAAKKMVENIRNGNPQSTGEILKQSGYSEAISKSPNKVTKSKGWNELMEQYMPDTLLAEQHKKLVTAKNKIRISKKGDILTEIEEPNTDAIARGLDMAYKLKGKYKPTKIDVQTFTGWAPEELETYAADGTVPERFRIEG